MSIAAVGVVEGPARSGLRRFQGDLFELSGRGADRWHGSVVGVDHDVRGHWHPENNEELLPPPGASRDGLPTGK
jgi:hypothetical protein